MMNSSFLLLKLQAVQQVISNLLISHIELRSEDSPDIQPYTHDRKVEKYVIPLGEDIARVKNAYLKVCTLHKDIITSSL